MVKSKSSLVGRMILVCRFVSWLQHLVPVNGLIPLLWSLGQEQQHLLPEKLLWLILLHNLTKWETFEIKHVIRQNDLSPSFLTPVLNKIHHIVFVRERSKHKCNACTNPDAHDSCDTNSRKWLASEVPCTFWKRDKKPVGIWSSQLFCCLSTWG